MSTLRTYVLVLNWNGWPDTLACLESLMRQRHSPLRVVVWDNGSSDASATNIVAWAEGRLDPLPNLPRSLHYCVHPPVSKPVKLQVLTESDLETPAAEGLILVRGGANLGYAGGNNSAMRYALAQPDCSNVWILNNDVVVDVNCLQDLHAAATADALDRPVGSHVYHMDSPDLLQACGGQRIGVGPLLAPRYVWRPQDIDYLVGASIFLSKQRAQALGPFNEDYFLNAEDLEYSYPYKLQFVLENPGLDPFLVAGRVWHRESSTQSRNRFLHAYYYTRNLLHAARRLGHMSCAATLLHAVLRAGNALLRGRRQAFRGTTRGICDFAFGVIGPYRERS